MCVICTDYNSVVEETKNSPNLYTTLKYFKKFSKAKIKEENNQDQYNNQKNIEFYDWLVSNTNYIQDLEILQKIYHIFDLTKNHQNIKKFEDIKIANSIIVKEEIIEILKTDGFIFPCK